MGIRADLSPQRSPRPTAIGVAAILLWSALALLTTATGGIPPFELLALSFGIACFAGLGLLAARGGEALRLLRQPAGAWGLGFAGLFFYHALYFFALKAAPPAPASLIAYFWPLLIVLFSASLPGEGLRLRHLFGATLGLAGTALLLLAPGAAASGGHAPALGFAAAFGCALVWSGYSVLNRRYAHVPGEMIAGVCGLVALAALPGHFALERSVVPDTGQWMAIALLGIGPTGLAFYAWDHATKRGNLPVLGALSYLAPLLSTALLIAAGRAPLSPALLVAAVLVIGGAAAATFGIRLRPRAAPRP